MRRSANSNRGRKRADKGRYRTPYALTELLYCSKCGKPYRCTIWKIGDKSKGVWCCADRLESSEITCKKSPSIHEDKLHMIENTEQLNSAVHNSIEQSRNEIIKIDEQIGIISEKIAEINTVRDTLLGNISGLQFDQISGELKTPNE